MRRFLLLSALMAVSLLAIAGVSSAARSGVSAAPARVNFVRVPVGSSVTAFITMQNNTGSSVVLSSIDVPSGGFTGISGACASPITPGDTCNATIRFAPTAAGNFGGKVVFHWDDESSPGTEVTTTTVGVTGKAG